MILARVRRKLSQMLSWKSSQVPSRELNQVKAEKPDLTADPAADLTAGLNPTLGQGQKAGRAPDREQGKRQSLRAGRAQSPMTSPEIRQEQDLVPDPKAGQRINLSQGREPGQRANRSPGRWQDQNLDPKGDPIINLTPGWTVDLMPELRIDQKVNLNLGRGRGQDPNPYPNPNPKAGQKTGQGTGAEVNQKRILHLLLTPTQPWTTSKLVCRFPNCPLPKATRSCAAVKTREKKTRATHVSLSQKTESLARQAIRAQGNRSLLHHLTLHHAQALSEFPKQKKSLRQVSSHLPTASRKARTIFEDKCRLYLATAL